VRFQWIDADGQTVARAKRSSRSCFQPDHRPNLKLKALTREGKHRYAALIVNTGRTAPGPFDLQLAVGASLLAPVTVPDLAPGAKRLVTLRGPVCEPGSSATATADPLDLVDERSEADNALTIACE
jgi:CARDB